MTLKYREPLPPKKRVLVNFSQFSDAAHISTLNYDEMAGDRPRQPAYKIFSIKRTFLQSKSRPLDSRGRRRRQSGYFSAIITCNMKTVADRHRHAAYHYKQ